MEEEKEEVQEEIKPTVYTREFIVKEIARREGFVYNDVLVIFKAFVNIVADIVANGGIIRIPRLFTMTVFWVASYKGWDGIRKEPMIVPAKKKVNFKASKFLQKIANGDWEFEEDEQGIQDLE